MLNDEEIKKDIVNQLYWDQSVDASDILVEVSGGHVTLKGTVPSHNARGAAFTDALIMPGVVKVKNEITVIPERRLPPVSEEEIQKRAENTLTWNADIDSKAVTIDVNAGVITLSGYVDVYWKKEYLEELVSALLGIVEVRNNIVIAPTNKVEDKLVAKDIMAALERSVDVDMNQIDITVENGVVTLSGFVQNQGTITEVGKIVMYTAGVIDVDNGLEVL